MHKLFNTRHLANYTRPHGLHARTFTQYHVNAKLHYLQLLPLVPIASSIAANTNMPKHVHLFFTVSGEYPSPSVHLGMA